MLCLKHTGADVLVQGAILKAGDYAAALDAQGIIARAEEEARLIREAAQRDAAAEKERGYRDGVEQGKEEIAERVVTTAGQSTVYFSKLEEALVDVVIKSTRRVIGEVAERERVERIVREALELLRNQNRVSIKVPPAQREWLQGRVTELLAAFPRVQFLEVHADSRLPADGCILETEHGVIDATVETQLRAIEKALIKAIK